MRYRREKRIFSGVGANAGRKRSEERIATFMINPAPIVGNRPVCLPFGRLAVMSLVHWVHSTGTYPRALTVV